MGDDGTEDGELGRWQSRRCCWPVLWDRAGSGHGGQVGVGDEAKGRKKRGFGFFRNDDDGGRTTTQLSPVVGKTDSTTR